MKKLFLILTFFVATNLSAQITGRIFTDHTTANDMVWSDIEKKFMFFDKIDRFEEFNMIETNVNSFGTGTIVITKIKTRQMYTFTVYKTEVNQNDEGRDYVKFECIEVDSGNQCTFIFLTSGDKRLVNVMLPADKLAIFMDDFGNQ